MLTVRMQQLINVAARSRVRYYTNDFRRKSRSTDNEMKNCWHAFCGINSVFVSVLFCNSSLIDNNERGTPATRAILLSGAVLIGIVAAGSTMVSFPMAVLYSLNKWLPRDDE